MKEQGRKIRREGQKRERRDEGLIKLKVSGVHLIESE